MTIEHIVNNWINGNKKDVVQNLRDYGFNAFIVAVLNKDEQIETDMFHAIIKYYAVWS